MTLSDNWTAQSVERFSHTSGIRTAHCVDMPVVIEHNPGHSLRKLAMAGLAGRKLLWIRCKRAERDEKLAWLGNPEGVITLDDYKIESDTSRPATLRRRRTLTINARGGVSQVTQDIDLAQNLVVVRSEGDRYRTYIRLGPQSSMPMGDLQLMTATLRSLGVLPDSMTLLVKTDNEGMKENWSWFSGWITTRLAPIAAEYRPTGYEGMQLSSLGRRVQALAEMPEHLLIGMHLEIVSIIREAMRLRMAITGGADRASNAYRAHEILRRLGTAPVVPQMTTNPIEILSERIASFETVRPAFAVIMSALNTYHSYYSRGHDHYSALVEYGRLLAHAPRIEQQQEAA